MAMKLIFKKYINYTVHGCAQVNKIYFKTILVDVNLSINTFLFEILHFLI